MPLVLNGKRFAVRAYQPPYGPTGPTGPQGEVGATGPQGEQGPTGPVGQDFTVAEVFNSVAELQAGSVPEGQFGLVAGTLSETNVDYGKLYLRSGGSWVYQTDMSTQGVQGPTGPAGTAVGGNVYDISVFVSGKPSASEIVFRMVASRSFQISTTAINHKGECVISSVAAKDFEFKKNGVTFATGSFAAGAFSPTFTINSPSDCSFVAGDVLTIVAPSAQDLTLSDVFFTLLGSI